MTRRPLTPFAIRLHRRLVALLLPAHFRATFGDELALVFEDMYEDATRHGESLAGMRLLVGEVPSLLVLTIRERREERAERIRLAACEPHAEGTTMLESLMQDLRWAARSIRRSPAFALVIVLTLALGIGANTAIYSVIDGVLLRPLPFHEPDRLVAVGEADVGGSLNGTSAGSFYDWRRQARAVRIAGYGTTAATLTGMGEPQRMTLGSTIGGTMEVLGVQPLFGRVLTEADEAPGSERAIVLSHDTWQRLFGEDRSVLGRSLTFGGNPVTIVGVMPPSFRFPDGLTEGWVPMQLDEARRANRDQYFIAAIGRLAPDAALEGAQRELSAIALGLQRDWPLYNTDLQLLAQPLQETIVGGVRTRLLVIMGAVALVLLIACANIGNMLLARSSTRRREIAVRRALGAGSARIARQVLTESLLLALAGGMAGVVAGKWLLQLLLAAQATTNLPRVDDIALDQRVLLFTLGISVAAGLFFGSFPAWQLARGDAAGALRSARGSTGREWARSALVVAEVAMAMMLLTGAGLLLRSFAALQRVEPGFTAERVLTFDLVIPPQNPSFVSTSLERLRAIPGVRSAAVVNQFPLTGRGIGAWYNRIDRPLPTGVTPDAEPYRVVTPEYFETIGLPLKRGRLFTRDERPERAGVVVNEALVRKYYATEEPIGKEIYLGAPDNRLFPAGVIVGVVGDTRDAGLGSDAMPTVYAPYQVMPYWRGFSYVVRTEGAPENVAAEARRVIREMDATLPVRNLRTLDDVLDAALASERWSAALLGTFAGVALVMAAIGVFGVLSFVVTQRTRELGIRIALGAAPRAVRRLVVRRGLALVTGGVVLGLAGAYALTKLMASLLYEVAPTDPATYVAVAAVLGGVATLASWLPARRATRIDPMVALRGE